MTREDKARAIRVRCIREAEYIINNYSTLRETSLEFNVSKSTVSSDMKRLKDINKNLYKSVRKILDAHKRKYKRKKPIYQNILRIYGNRKGEVKSHEYIIAANYRITAPVCKYEKRKYEVTVPIMKQKHTEKEIKEIYNKVLSQYLAANSKK